MLRPSMLNDIRIFIFTELFRNVLAPKNSFALQSVDERHTIACANKDNRSKARSYLMGFEGSRAINADESELVNHETTAASTDEPTEECQARKSHRKTLPLSGRQMLLSSVMEPHAHRNSTNIEMYVEHFQIAIHFFLNIDLKSIPILNLQR